MLFLSPLLTLVVLATVPALLFVSLRLRRVMFPAQWDSLQRAGEVAGVVDEAVSGVRVVKGFGQEDRELARLDRRRRRSLPLAGAHGATAGAVPVGAAGDPGVGPGRRSSRSGGGSAIQGEISIGTFLAFSTYLVQLLAPVRMFAGMVAVAEQARAGTERIFELIDSNPLVAEQPGRRGRSWRPHAEIVFDRVTYGYLRSEPVLRDFSLRVAPGETVALVGASGSGKSTVSLLLPRFYDVQDGAVRIDGIDVRDVTLDSIRHEIGIVFEDAFLFSDTVRANIAYGRPDAADADVERRGTHRGRARVHRGAAAGLRHGRGRTGPDALRGSAAAHLHRPCRPHRSARPRARRRHLVGRHEDGGADPRHPARDHGRPHDGPHRPSPLDPAPRRPHRGDGRWSRGRDRDARGADGGIVARYRMLLEGPDGDLDGAGDTAAPDPGVTASLWDRTDESEAARAFVLPAGSARDRAQRPRRERRVGTARRRWRHRARRPPPNCSRLSTRSPPADDDPDVDVAAEAAASEHFRLRAFLRPYRRPLLIGFGLIVVDTLLTLAGPFFVQQGLNEGVQDHATGALWVASVLFLGTTLVDWAVTWAYSRYTGRTAERLLFALRIRIFSHLQRLALDFYDREMSGRIMTRMTTDVDAFAQLLQTGLITALVNILSFVGVLVVLSLLSWPLTVGVLVLVPPLLIATVWFGRRSARAYAHARETISSVNAEFQESISGVRESQAYVREERNITSFRTTASRYLDARLRTQVLQALYFPFILFLATCGDAIVLGLGSALVHDGTIAAGTVIAFLLYLDQFFAPVQQLSQVFDQWQQAVASMTKINELMLTPLATPDPVDPIEPGEMHGAIRFADVHFSYPGTGRETLHGVDLDIEPGETVALVGETGAGKSTLVKLIARFYDADSGQVLVDGVPVTDLDLRTYRRRLGYVPQEAFLFSGTIRDNIAYGRPDAPDVDVERAARAVGAHDFIADLRGGYLHPVTERGRSLSAGQRQLICLARALLVDPAILLLDEATANLDLSTEARVQRAMGLVARNRTTVLIAHRLQTARTADRIVVVDDGRIAEIGSHDELLARGGSYAELWNRNLDSSISPYGGVAPLVATRRRVLLRLEHLVDVEEVLDLVEQALRQVAEIAHVLVVRVVQRHAQDLGVRTLLVLHPEHADRAHLHPAPGEGRVLEQHQHVERVAVEREGVGDEAVVGRVDGRGEQPPVEADDVRVVVVLVLVAAAARDLDDDVERRSRDHLADPATRTPVS